MDYIARHYHMDLALIWALRLEGKTDQENKESYEEFIESFFIFAHRNTKETTRMAFLNADWRDFESTPASKENPDNSITIFDYHRVLSKTGWKVTHRIECPLSSERLSGNQVQKMQDKRILGTVGRTLLIAKRS
jgi:hypothetical protein